MRPTSDLKAAGSQTSTKNNRNCYATEYGVDKVEYHAESLTLFQERMSQFEFGGN